ncbi:uncharacterized protein LOC143198220 isoform X1 [Rhynchophorus ferrugineus]|uniref:uncharacterized protein LOC143198220 isoform X1 n=1 Tax=Rhynchophorus ferrugineus TaxID=354439 RepID=UPI003FCE8C34
MDCLLECRICLDRALENHLIRLETKLNNEKNILQIIEEFAEIQIHCSDFLPRHICKKCLNNLESSVTFRKQIIASDNELQKRSVSVLSEPLSNESRDKETGISNASSISLKKGEANVKVEKIENGDSKDISEIKVNIPLNIEIKEDNIDNAKTTELQDIYSDFNGFGTSNNSSDEESLYKALKKNPINTKRVRKKLRQKKEDEDSSDSNDSDVPLQNLKKELSIDNRSTIKVKQRERKDSLDSPRLCPICGKMFKARQNFNSHMTTVHRKKTSKPEKMSCLCPDCGRVITGTRQNFVAHIRYHHSDKAQVKKRFTCDICPKKFYREKNLIIHLKLHKGEKGYVCELCPDKAYTQIGGLILHRRKVHLKKPTCTCNYCGKQFYEKHYLETHIRQWHTGERPFSCEICGKSFSCNGTLLRHRKDSHGEKKPCPKCGKMYTEGELRKHLKRHKIREEGIKRKKYTCEYCGTEMNFTSRKRHLLKQHGIMLRGRGETAERVPVNRSDAM